jgi:hypothetical protein
MPKLEHQNPKQKSLCKFSWLCSRYEQTVHAIQLLKKLGYEYRWIVLCQSRQEY